MALTVTSLAAACGISDQVVTVTSATGATAGGFVKVDAEYMRILSISGTQPRVARQGEFGGAVAAHTVLASVVFGLNADLADLGTYALVPVPFTKEDQVNVGANGVIAVPTRDTIFYITKGSALASSTFANPSASQNGLTVTFAGVTDFAHVVTTVAVQDGTSGAHTTCTSAAFAGSTLTLVAYNAKWMVRSNNLWVIT
jgi:hypothetical protein